MTPKQSLLRRCLAVLTAALVAGVLAVLSTWVPVGATGTPGDGKDRDDAQALQIVLIEDRGSGLPWPVQGRRFNVVVQAVDANGQPTEVHEPTKIKLIEVSGPGRLGGNTTAIIQKNLSSTTIKGATYSQYANGVVLAVKVVYGEDLERDEITVEVALTAVGADAKPGKPLKLKDPNCAAPTSKVPTCGVLVLNNGADGRVTLSVGSCDGLVKVPGRDECAEAGNVQALVVTAIANLNDFRGKPLYSRKDPAKVILSCDKVALSQDAGRDQVQGDLHPEQHRSAEEGCATVPEEGCTWQRPRGLRGLQAELPARRRPLLALPLQNRRPHELLLIERAQQSTHQIRDTHEAQLADSGSGTRTTPSDPRAALASCSNCAAPGSWRSTAMRAATASRNPRS